jgi:hypothetical protein
VVSPSLSPLVRCTLKEQGQLSEGYAHLKPPAQDGGRNKPNPSKNVPGNFPGNVTIRSVPVLGESASPAHPALHTAESALHCTLHTVHQYTASQYGIEWQRVRLSVVATRNKVATSFWARHGLCIPRRTRKGRVQAWSWLHFRIGAERPHRRRYPLPLRLPLALALPLSGRRSERAYVHSKF